MQTQPFIGNSTSTQTDIDRDIWSTRLGIFGSVARGEATNTSDVDVVVEMPPDLCSMVHLKHQLQESLQVSVDLVRYRPHMNAFLKRRIDQEAIYV
ncbi:MAG: nucleotidyltransferase domain-containing protein [Cyanobacteria bacterium P01_C01_bin.120]